MRIDIENNKKNEAIKEFLATLLEKLKEEKNSIQYKKNIFEKQNRYRRISQAYFYLELIDLGMKHLKNIQFESIDNIDSVRKLKEAEAFFSKYSNYFTCLKNVEFSECTSKINAQFLIYADIEVQLDALFDKANDLFHQQFNAEGDAIHELVFDFKRINRAYFKTNEIQYEEYKLRALFIMDKAKLILVEQDYRYKMLFANILLLILTLGTAFILNKAINGHFLFFQKINNSEQLVKLNQTLSQLSL